tara:strand:+ start:453 stop:800 length:348 start_codon:yes stop_codon:yes gene_type:complete
MSKRKSIRPYTEPVHEFCRVTDLTGIIVGGAVVRFKPEEARIAVAKAAQALHAAVPEATRKDPDKFRAMVWANAIGACEILTYGAVGHLFEIACGVTRPEEPSGSHADPDETDNG